MSSKSALDFYNEANTLFIDEEYEKALELYNKAIEIGHDEDSVFEFYDKRSNCHYVLHEFEKAINDAEEALKIHPKSLRTYLKKGKAYFELDNFEEAKKAFESGLSIDSSDKKLNMWLKKAIAELKEIDQQKSKNIKVQKEETKKEEEKNQNNVQKESQKENKVEENKKIQEEQKEETIMTQKIPSLKDKIKYDHYQMGSDVVVGVIGLRTIPKENRKYSISDNSINVSIELPDGDKWEKTIELFREIIPEQSRVSSLTSKLEFTLRKKEVMNWDRLEKNQAQKKPLDPRRYYPSSKGDKDWDSLNTVIEKEVPEEKPEGDAALNTLFQSIYSNADEDTRKAMIKSFTESGGTVLSTNWKDVGKGKVKGESPKGMEMKSYNTD